jgi:mitochondrial protein import protein ZIM17
MSIQADTFLASRRNNGESLRHGWGSDTRSTKAFSSQAYNHGVVIVQCDGCKNRHLLADRLGWFGDPGSIEDFLSEKGEEVRRKLAGGETLQLTEDDLKGWTPKRGTSS